LPLCVEILAESGTALPESAVKRQGLSLEPTILAVGFFNSTYLTVLRTPIVSHMFVFEPVSRLESISKRSFPIKIAGATYINL
jgi:hypothetical protein